MNLDIALSWYAYPFNAKQWDALACAIGERLIALGLDAGEKRYQGDTHALIQTGDFAVAQCCGIDAWRYQSRVKPIGLPLFAGADDAGFYASVVLTRADSPLASLGKDEIYDQILSGKARFAVNQRYSWSGSLVARQELGYPPSSIWQSWPETGGHRASVDWLVAGRADVVLLDEFSWGFMKQSGDFAADAIAVIGRTGGMPRCPFVVPRHRPEVEEAVRSVLADLQWETLGIKGFSFAEPEFWLDAFATAAKELGIRTIEDASC